jgi:hypothetical protein
MGLGEMRYENVNCIHLVNTTMEFPSSTKGKKLHDQTSDYLQLGDSAPWS